MVTPGARGSKDPRNGGGVPLVVVEDELDRTAEQSTASADALAPDLMGDTGRPAVVREGTGQLQAVPDADGRLFRGHVRRRFQHVLRRAAASPS
ncbi:hypothetical protein GCM10010294_30590 [Streptomyces griseoloalbus]|nr:hypothetical protein GCM10010294_30590 [Streptomyces griseoloalbus]